MQTVNAIQYACICLGNAFHFTIPWHVKSNSSQYKQPLCPGQAIHMQAWTLKRRLSIYNDIVRRQHLPREPGIRRLMRDTGIDLSTYGPPPREEEEEQEEINEVEDDTDQVCYEENPESEAEEEDPCFLAVIFVSIQCTYVCMLECHLGDVHDHTYLLQSKAWKKVPLLMVLHLIVELKLFQ